jgi:branched-chain amino acid transport system permease protein
MDYLIHLLVLWCIYSLIAFGLNVGLGYAGLFSVAQMTWAAVGGFGIAILTKKFGLDYVFAVPIAVGIGLCTAFCFGWIAARMRNEVFMFATFALQLVVTELLIAIPAVSGGLIGISGLAPISVFGMRITGPTAFLCVALPAVIPVAMLCATLRSTRLGTEFLAVREDEVYAQSLGINTSIRKAVAFAIGGGAAAFGGCLLAIYTRYVEPLSYDIQASILILAIVLIGGAGQPWSPIWGTAVVLFLPEVLRLLPLSDNAFAHIRQALFGAILVAIMRFRPKGISGDSWFRSIQ